MTTGSQNMVSVTGQHNEDGSCTASPSFSTVPAPNAPPLAPNPANPPKEELAPDALKAPPPRGASKAGAAAGSCNAKEAPNAAVDEAPNAVAAGAAKDPGAPGAVVPKAPAPVAAPNEPPPEALNNGPPGLGSLGSATLTRCERAGIWDF